MTCTGADLAGSIDSATSSRRSRFPSSNFNHGITTNACMQHKSLGLLFIHCVRSQRVGSSNEPGHA